MNAPNLLTTTITVDTTAELAVSKDRSFLMIINNEADNLIVKLGREDLNGIPVFANGGHLSLPCGVLGPIYLSAAAAIDVTIVSPLPEVDALL